jgi:hypothetical protein
LAASLTHDRVFRAGNDASRFAHIEALVDQGRSSIDDSRFAWTPDRVVIEGRSYSNKPPLLALVGAGLYRVGRPLLGLGFSERERHTVYWLTLLLVGTSLAALFPLFYRATAFHLDAPVGIRLLATAALGLGTVLTSFGGTLNGHVPAATLMLACLVAALASHGFWAGACLALAVCIDIVPGVFFIPAAASIVRDTAGRRGVLRFLAAGALGGVLFVAANLATVGHPFPPKLVPGGVDLSSRMAPSLAGVVLPASWTYPIECLFGWHGFFSVSPVLIFGLAGLVVALRGTGPLTRRSAWMVLVSVAATIGFHALVAGSFGGWSYGFRYLIPTAPILLFFAPLVLRGPATWAFAATLAVSLPLALLGAYHPWPPVDEQLPDRGGAMSVRVDNPVGANLAGWLQEYWPEADLTERVAVRVISADPGERQRYLEIYFRSKGDLRMQAEVRRRAASP